MAADRLPFGLTAEALAEALAEPDPDSLGAATRLRRRHAPEVAAAALQQAALRRRAVAKFGSRAGGLFLTRAGLEQATRPEVAAHHAGRLVAAGAHAVVDLGCGIGADALAFLAAGLQVTAVERDEAAAAAAAANLGPAATVLCADAEQVADRLLGPGVAAFCDPARRDAAGRVWRTADFTPSWTFVTGLLDGQRPAGVKLGPALPHEEIPSGVEAEWISHRGTVVEVGLWAGPGSRPNGRSALIWPDARLAVTEFPELAVRPPGSVLYEPDGAVIRAGGVAQLGAALGAGLLDPHIAYLTADHAQPTPYAAGFAVTEVLPFDERRLRSWVRQHRVGELEIKRRGVDLDPARLRARLRPSGPQRATLVISRTPQGALALVVDRLVPQQKITS